MLILLLFPSSEQNCLDPDNSGQAGQIGEVVTNLLSQLEERVTQGAETLPFFVRHKLDSALQQLKVNNYNIFVLFAKPQYFFMHFHQSARQQELSRRQNSRIITFHGFETKQFFVKGSLLFSYQLNNC